MRDQSIVGKRELASATAAYLAGRGYYVSTGVEMPQCEQSPDVFAIRLHPGQLLRRAERGGAPSGIACFLSGKRWQSTETVAEAAGYPVDFVRAVLWDAEALGWVKSSVKEGGAVLWAAGDYRFPARECLLLQCAGDLDASFGVLDALRGCFHKGYVVFPYRVDAKTVERSVERGYGLWVYDRRIAVFDQVAPAKRFKIADLKSAAAICERMMVERCLFSSTARLLHPGPPTS